MPIRTSAGRRAGFSLIEVLVVMAIVIIVGGVLAPTFTSINRDTQVKAAVDLIRGRVADARGAAVGENRTYRLALSTDGRQVRVAPDDAAFDTQAATDDADVDGPVVAVDEFPKGVTVTPVVNAAEEQAVADEAGWVRVATFRPDGTCRDDQSIVQVAEPGVAPVWVRIRGLTGATTVGPAPAGGGL